MPPNLFTSLLLRCDLNICGLKLKISKEACAPFMVIHFCSGLGHLTEKTLKLPQLESCCLMLPEESSLVLIVCHSILGYNFLSFSSWSLDMTPQFRNLIYRLQHPQYMISGLCNHTLSDYSVSSHNEKCSQVSFRFASLTATTFLFTSLTWMFGSSIMLLPQPCCRLQTNFSFSQKQRHLLSIDFPKF